MFVVITYVYKDHGATFKPDHTVVHGIVYNLGDFDRFVNERHSGIVGIQEPIPDVYGDLSLAYKVSPYVDIVMKKIEEVGQPKN